MLKVLANNSIHHGQKQCVSSKWSLFYFFLRSTFCAKLVRCSATDSQICRYWFSRRVGPKDVRGTVLRFRGEGWTLKEVRPGFTQEGRKANSERQLVTVRLTNEHPIKETANATASGRVERVEVRNLWSFLVRSLFRKRRNLDDHNDSATRARVYTAEAPLKNCRAGGERWPSHPTDHLQLLTILIFISLYITCTVSI